MINIDPESIYTGALGAAEFARRAEDWGYSAMWFGEAVGRDPFAQIAYLLARTDKMIYATGIANIWEVAQHVRGEGGPRQIEDAKVGLAHVIGLGSACGIHILEKSGLAAA